MQNISPLSKRFIFLFSFLFIQTLAFAQWQEGPQSVSVGGTYQYSYKSFFTTGNWTISPSYMGTVVSSWLSGDRTIAYATIKWNAPGTATVTVKNGSTIKGTRSVTATCGTMYAPSFTTQRVYPTNASTNVGCTGASFRVDATPGTNGQTVYWYYSESDEYAFSEGNSFTTPYLNSNTTYYIATSYDAGGNCVSGKVAVPINIHPPPTVIADNQQPNICSGNGTVIYLSNDNGVSGTEFFWTVSASNVSGAASGNGAVISQTLSTTTSSTGSVTYTVTPWADGCSGTPINVTVYVKPRPDAYASNQSICSGQGTSISISTPNGVSSPTYSWTVSQSNVSGASSGSGSYIGQTLSNSTSSNGTATYTITPTANGCSGNNFSVVATVKPIPNVSVSNNLPSLCSGQTSSISIGNPNGVSGTSFSWTVSPLNVSGASNSSGSAISQTLSATSNVNGSVGYSVTPSANGCSGSPVSTSVTVKPVPNVAASGQTFCSGGTTSINITNPNGVSGTTFSWTASPSGVTGSASGSGSSIAQTLTASSSSNGTVTYNITPTANGCSGSVVSPVVTVKPVPTISVTNNLSSFCSGSTTSISITNPNAVSGTTFSWTTSASNTSGYANGSGSSIGQTLSATSNVNGSVSYTATATSNGCSSAPSSTSVTVKPIPNVAASGQTFCSGGTTSINITNPNGVSGTTFSWTVSTSNVTGASSGSGSSIAQTLTNSTQFNGSAIYTITPTVNACSGSAITATATVNPRPGQATVPSQTIQFPQQVTLTNTSTLTDEEQVRWYNRYPTLRLSIPETVI